MQARSFEGKFADPRWVNGTCDLAQFNGANGETDWDAVIDAEVRAPYFARPTRSQAACCVSAPPRSRNPMEMAEPRCVARSSAAAAGR